MLLLRVGKKVCIKRMVLVWINFCLIIVCFVVDSGLCFLFMVVSKVLWYFVLGFGGNIECGFFLVSYCGFCNFIYLIEWFVSSFWVWRICWMKWFVVIFIWLRMNIIWGVGMDYKFGFLLMIVVVFFIWVVNVFWFVDCVDIIEVS